MFETAVLLLLLGSFTFLSPVRVDGDELWTTYALAFIAIFSWVFPRKRDISFKIPALFVSVLLVSMFFNPLAQPLRMSFANLFMGVFAIKSIAERWEWSTRRFGAVLFLFHCATLVLLRLQVLDLDLIYKPLSGQVSGSFIMPWSLGCFSALSVPFLIALHPIAAVIALPGLYYSQSSICVFASAVGAVLMLPRYGKRITAALMLGALIAICFNLIPFEVARFRILVGSFPFIKSWMWGNGIGSWAHEGFARNNGADLYYWRFAHNEFYQLFFEAGALGVIVGFTLWVYLLRKKSRLTVSSITVMSLLCFFHSMLHYGRLVLFCALITAFALKDSTSPRRT